MKITCSRTALLTAMQIASAATASRTTKPVLANVKAVAFGDSLTITAQDLEAGIRYELRGVNVLKTGEAILAAAQLTSILRETDDADVIVTANEDGAEVKVGGSKWNLPGFPVNEFPDLPQFDATPDYHEVSAGDLRTMIRRTMFAADGKDSTRFALNSVLWEADGKTARAVATDSKRLAVTEKGTTLHGSAPKAKTAHLLPQKALKLLQQVLADDEENVRVCLRPNEAMFRTERATIYTRLVEGRYPPYRDILSQTAKQADTKITLPAQSFLSRVKQAKIMTDAESCRITLTFADGKLTLAAKDAALGSSHVEMAVPGYDGPDMTISFDPDYLVEYLRVVVAENEAANVVLETNRGGDRPALFGSEGDGMRYLVMPLAG